MDIRELLIQSCEQNASDLHLVPGSVPLVRVYGDLVPLKDHEAFSSDQIRELIFKVMREDQQGIFEKNLLLEFALFLPPIGNFRVSIYTEEKGIAAVLRIIPEVIPSFAELQLPTVFKSLLGLSSGLIIVTGATGSGKSTTLASMIDFINTSQACSIITIEDPIEFLHKNKKSAIHQLQVGRDTPNFQAALRASLRQDPDVILIGEMRDLETIRLALSAAETGHLVLTTLHARSAPLSIGRIIDMFPSEEQNRVRNLLSETIQAAIYQTLVKRKEGGRVAAFEIMVGTPGIRHLIHQGMLPQIESSIQTGSDHGMCSLGQYIDALQKNGTVHANIARNYKIKKGKFNEL